MEARGQRPEEASAGSGGAEIPPVYLPEDVPAPGACFQRYLLLGPRKGGVERIDRSVRRAEDAADGAGDRTWGTGPGRRNRRRWPGR